MTDAQAVCECGHGKHMHDCCRAGCNACVIFTPASTEAKAAADRGELGEACPHCNGKQIIQDDYGTFLCACAPTPVWRTGKKVGRTIYAGDTLIGVMDRREDAELVVRAVNAMKSEVGELAKALGFLRELQWNACVDYERGCLFCGASPGIHLADCRLGVFLSKHPEVK